MHRIIGLNLNKRKNYYKNYVFAYEQQNIRLSAFTLVEMLMALLIVSVILSASIPVITSRTKAAVQSYSKYSAVPIGMIAMWKADGAMPDNTWLEANGQVIPNGIEFEECRRIFGSRLPDLRGADSEFYNNLNNYISKDIKDYLQNVIKPMPKDGIIIWGTNAAIPEGWSEAAEYRGVFLRGYGSITHTQNNGTTVGNTATAHHSGAIGAVQGDGMRKLWGDIFSLRPTDNVGVNYGWAGMTRWHQYNSPAYTATKSGSSSSADFIELDSSRIVPTYEETRPINKAVRYIKYTTTSTMPEMPSFPQYTQRFRYIVKVKN